MSDHRDVALAGEIDLAAAESTSALLDEEVARAIADGHGLRVDLREVTFVDSSGLACLARASVALAAAGQAMQLVHVPPFTRRLLEVAGLQPLADPPEAELGGDASS
ncbi:MAG: STAS domain-containing protein [Acidimicrobiales bacterium]